MMELNENFRIPAYYGGPGGTEDTGGPGYIKSKGGTRCTIRVRSVGGTEYHFYTMPQCSSMCHHSAISKVFYIFILDLNRTFSAEIISMGYARSSKQNNIRIKWQCESEVVIILFSPILSFPAYLIGKSNIKFLTKATWLDMELYETKYLRMDKVKFVEESLKNLKG